MSRITESAVRETTVPSRRCEPGSDLREWPFSYSENISLNDSVEDSTALDSPLSCAGVVFRATGLPELILELDMREVGIEQYDHTDPLRITPTGADGRTGLSTAQRTNNPGVDYFSLSKSKHRAIGILQRWKMRLALLVSFLMMAMGMTSMAQKTKDTAKEIDIPYERFVLDNGLTVIVHEDHKAPIVAINTWYHVGSKNEKPGKTGFAHLFEHLMFGGSEHAPGRYIDGMERIGATDLNGTTNPDRTNYFENVPTSAVDFTLWMESDRMGHLLGALDQKTLDLQRGVVQNEKRQGENQPYGVTRQLLTQNTYPVGHPYSWTTIGEMADLDAASMTDVKDWFKTYYGPSNVVIVIAGDIDAKIAKEKVTKYFGDIPAGPPVALQEVWLPRRN